METAHMTTAITGGIPVATLEAAAIGALLALVVVAVYLACRRLAMRPHFNRATP